MQSDSQSDAATPRILTSEEVQARSKSNLRIAWILALVAVGFFISAWFIDIS